MTFEGFTQETLDFYPRLRAGGNTTKAYNAIKNVYRDSVKPQMIELLEHISNGLSSKLESLQFDSDSDIGMPFIHGRAVNYAWGAITRKGKTKHTDLQFYVALRYDYLRFGIYTKNEKKSQQIFGEIYRKILSNTSEFLELLDELETEGIFITTKIANEESGKPKPLPLRRSYPADSIYEDGTFNVMTAIPIEELQNIDVGDAVMDAFMKIMPIYQFVLSIDS
jgi:hypothetical protein